MTNQPKTIELVFDLFELPTAQHKAGLAGLLVLIQTMRGREMNPLPEYEMNATQVTLRLTSESFQSLINELYAADLMEVGREKKKAKGKKDEKTEIPPKRTEEKQVTKNNKVKLVPMYIYDEVIPRGAFFKWLMKDNCDVWLKLWRDMLWSTLRAQDLSRNVYKDCLNGCDSPIAAELWKKLEKSQTAKIEGKFEPTAIAGSLFIGAQEDNAENVPFQGTIEHTLLLHFWQLVSLIFVPQRVTIEGEREHAGYLLVIPEPSDLEAFTEDMLCFYDLDLDCTVAGFRPRAALIDVPAEGGLEYIYQLVKSQVKKKAFSFSLSAVEVFHLEKRGNNVRLLTAERIVVQRRLLERYENIRTRFFNPLFKNLRFQNLLRNEPWYVGSEDLFTQYPWQFFIQSQKTPPHLPFWGRDVRQTFDELKERNQMSQDADDKLATCIQRLIRTYVTNRSEEKSGVKFDSLSKDEKGRRMYPSSYREAVEKVCSDAFLAMRGRKDKDFIEYFTGTICAVPQWLPEEDYLLIIQSLFNDSERVKTIAMLALSAQSYFSKASTESQEGVTV